MNKTYNDNEFIYNEDGVLNPNESHRIDTVAAKHDYANMIRELFKLDPDIKMTYDDKTCVLNMEVKSEIKTLALQKMLPHEKSFGNKDEKITINVYLSKARFGGDKFLPDTLYECFKNNPLFNYIYYWADPKATFSPYCWVVLKEKVLKWPCGDLHQVYGTHIELAEDTAGGIFNELTDYTFFCTDDGVHPMPDTPRARRFNPEVKEEE